ncbi:MAG: RNA 2',3'-cyclic phosphodiesterase [Thermodesulfobacteriota bacterium]
MTSGNGKAIRLFVAVKLPEKLLEMIGSLQAGLKRGFNFKRVSWARPAGIHLTLKFLGAVDESRIDEITGALQEAAAHSSPFTLETCAVSGFPNISSPRVLWLGIKESTGLMELQKAVDGSLAAIGFERDSRPFRPHLTIARIRSPEERRPLGALAIKLERDIFIEFRVDSFILFRSRLTPGGAVHSVIKRFEVAGGDSID